MAVAVAAAASEDGWKEEFATTWKRVTRPRSSRSSAGRSSFGKRTCSVRKMLRSRPVRERSGLPTLAAAVVAAGPGIESTREVRKLRELGRELGRAIGESFWMPTVLGTWRNCARLVS